MNPERRSFVLGTLAATLLAHPVVNRVRDDRREIQVPTEEGSPLTLLLEAYRRDNHIPGLAAAVVLDGRLGYCGGLGACESGTRRKVDSRTPFLIYSVSKVVTASLVLQLAERGEIDLDAPIRTYFPTLKVNAKGLSEPPVIRVRHLLAHSSGWGRENVGLPVRLVSDGTVAGTPLDEVFARNPVKYTPGTDHSYSNLNYALLARLVETTSGQPYAQVLQNTLLEPLGMKDSASGIRREAVDQSARGHLTRFSLMDWMLRYFYPSSFRRKLVARTEGLREQVLAPFELALPGYGDVVASAQDMGAFLRFQLDAQDPSFERVLPWSRRREMRDLHLGPYAWSSYKEASGLAYHHVGGGPGFRAHLLVIPEQEFGMVILTNRFVSEGLEPQQVMEAARQHVSHHLMSEARRESRESRESRA